MTKKYTAVGIHAFAGGFTLGVQNVMNVENHLETHGFGLETAREVVGVEPINCPAEEWPDIRADCAFGNPRCSAFSTLTSSCDDTAHGPWAKQTCDIVEFCTYAAGRYDVCCWESVQQANTTGRPLIDWLIRERFAPKGYRIAHLMINAATFGNPQQRKRYFFLAYRGGRNFNIMPPEISQSEPLAYDVLWPRRDRPTKEMSDTLSQCTDYDGDTYRRFNQYDKELLPKLPNGWGVNTFARYHPEELPEKYREMWEQRSSGLPFSLHCMYRTNYLRPFPTLAGSCGRFVHPEHDRPITVGEAAAVMGWGDKYPRGANPFAQIAKGIVPAAGEWLAQQMAMYLDDKWGADDWESSYDAELGEWTGGDTNGALEKTFDMTRYVGRAFFREDYAVSDEVLWRRVRDATPRAKRGR